MRLIDADALDEVVLDLNENKDYGITRGEYDLIEMVLLAFPIIEERKWIPCSETVDIPDHEILACNKYGEEMFGYLVYEDDQWICDSDKYVMYDPIAWREKPEPYREERGSR